MKIRVFRSGKGDALLLTSDGGKHMLVDGGVPDAYEEHWATTVGKLRDAGEDLELVYISHIDRDHIGGVLEMMDNEVAWRLFEFRSRTGRGRAREPKIKRPPKVKAIWHNAFLEKARRRQVRSSDHGASVLDVEDILFRNAQIHAAADETVLHGKEDGRPVSIAARELADRTQFLGQSVGDAIELSRRIGAKQLDIPLNPEFDGDFVVRKRGQTPFEIGGFKITVLGPTAAELDKLEKEWNTWLKEKASFLKTLQKKHKKDEAALRNSDLSDILEMARQASITLAGNQRVTPPNLASIIMLAENGGKSILLTGDADDPSIVAGLKASDRLDANGQILVDVFKIPHHGAHNSFSNTLAQTVVAKDYVFCGNGKNSNPEPDIIAAYLEVLLEGHDGKPPALPTGVKPTFWFNDGPKLESGKLKKHWERVEDTLKNWHDKHPGRFRHKLMKSGDSFLVT